METLMRKPFRDLWVSIEYSESYKKWCEEHSIEEQIDKIDWWSNYEYMDEYSMCRNIFEFFCVYCYIQFVLDVEFMQDVRELAEEEHDEAAQFLLDKLAEL